MNLRSSGIQLVFSLFEVTRTTPYVELQFCCFDHHEQSQLARPFLIDATGVAGDALGEGVEVHAGRAVSLVRLRVVPEVRRA